MGPCRALCCTISDLITSVIAAVCRIPTMLLEVRNKRQHRVTMRIRLLICLMYLQVQVGKEFWEQFKLDFWFCLPCISSRKVLLTSRLMRETLFRELVVFFKSHGSKFYYDYMERTQFRYAWATRWLGDPITFKTMTLCS